MESIPILPYDLLEHSHALLKHTLVFNHKENLGLFNVHAPIQVLAYGCLEGLSKAVYITITKSGIYLQHCRFTSSSSSSKKIHLKCIVSLMGKESPIDWKVGNFLLPIIDFT
jgi:hypothetical protein